MSFDHSFSVLGFHLIRASLIFWFDVLFLNLLSVFSFGSHNCRMGKKWYCNSGSDSIASFVGLPLSNYQCFMHFCFIF